MATIECNSIRLLPELDHRERLVLHLGERGMNDAHIARELGIHRANVARIRARAMTKVNAIKVALGHIRAPAHT
jgi:transcriptional regulator